VSAAQPKTPLLFRLLGLDEKECAFYVHRFTKSYRFVITSFTAFFAMYVVQAAAYPEVSKANIFMASCLFMLTALRVLLHRMASQEHAYQLFQYCVLYFSPSALALVLHIGGDSALPRHISESSFFCGLFIWFLLAVGLRLHATVLPIRLTTFGTIVLAHAVWPLSVTHWDRHSTSLTVIGAMVLGEMIGYPIEQQWRLHWLQQQRA